MIPTRIHGLIDYASGLLLLVAPLIAFGASGPAGLVPAVLGAATLVYSALTAYELGLIKLIPMPVHLGLDAMQALTLAASPWMFGFADRTWMPHLAFGLTELAVVAASSMQVGARRAIAATPP